MKTEKKNQRLLLSCTHVNSSFGQIIATFLSTQVHALKSAYNHSFEKSLMKQNCCLLWSILGGKLKKLPSEIVKKSTFLSTFSSIIFQLCFWALFRVWWVSKLRLSVNFSAFTGVFTRLTHKHQIKIPNVGLMLLLFSLDLARKIWNEKYSTKILYSCIRFFFSKHRLRVL